MAKRIIVAVALLLASALFTFIGMFIAPCGVGLFRSNVTYNIILAVVLAVITIITIILLCMKRLRIYSLLFIPHIIALGIIMLYVGRNIHYAGSGGFVSVTLPYKSAPQIQTTFGRVIFKDAHHIRLRSSYGNVFFFYDSRPYRIYDVDGNCIWERPEDDNRMGFCQKGFWSLREIKRGNSQIYRLRFFDFSGNYIFTRFYKRDPYFNEYKSIDAEKFIKETTEDVTELSDGTKKFRQGATDLSATSEEQKPESPTIVKQPRPSRQYDYAECPTCHGVGMHVKIMCSNCGGAGEVYTRKYLEFLKSGNPLNLKYFGPKTEKCPYCNGGYRKCPRNT